MADGRFGRSGDEQAFQVAADLLEGFGTKGHPPGNWVSGLAKCFLRRCKWNTMDTRGTFWWTVYAQRVLWTSLNSIHSEALLCFWQFVGIRGETCFAPHLIKQSLWCNTASERLLIQDIVKCWQCNIGYHKICMSTQLHQSAACRLGINNSWHFSSTHWAEFHRICRQISELCKTGKPQSFHHIPNILKVHSSCWSVAKSPPMPLQPLAGYGLTVRCTEQALSWFWIVGPKLQSTHLTIHKLGLICLTKPAFAVTKCLLGCGVDAHTQWL